MIKRAIRFSIWLSLTAPFIAVLLCYDARYVDTGWLSLGWWFWPDTYVFREVILTWRYAFLASGLIGLLALAASLIVKEKRLVWIALSGLALTALFAKLTVPWTLMK
jgi:hypothetical protein